MKKLNLDGWILPQPVLVVGAFDNAKRPIAMTASWAGQFGKKEIMMAFDNNPVSRKVLCQKDFTVSFATASTLAACDYIAIKSSDGDTTDIRQIGWDYRKSPKVDAPIFDAFPLALECHVKQSIEKPKFGYYVIADIIGVDYDEDYIGRDGQPDLSKMNIITLDPIHKHYMQIGERKGHLYHEGKKKVNLMIEKLQVLEKYRDIDCCIAPKIEHSARNTFVSEFRIETDEKLLLARDTSFWSTRDQGTVITDKGIYYINDNNQKGNKIAVSWGNVDVVKATQKEIQFVDKKGRTLLQVDVYCIVKNESDKPNVARLLAKTFTSIARMTKKEEADQRAAVVENRKRTRLFHNNFYEPFGFSEKAPWINFFRIKDGVMVTHYVNTSKIRGLWRVAYITKSEHLEDTVIYAKIPGLNALRQIFKYAQSEDNKFDATEFPAISQAISNTFGDKGVRITDRKVDDTNVYMLAMNLTDSYDKIIGSKASGTLTREIFTFMEECEKFTAEINRFTSHKRYKYNLQKVKQGGRAHEGTILAAAVTLKIGWWGYKILRAVNGGGSDNVDDSWVDSTVNSVFGTSNVDLSGLDNIQSNGNSILGIDTSDTDIRDIFSGGGVDINADFQYKIHTADVTPTSAGVNTVNYTIQPAPAAYDPQANGSVVVRDMFGMEHSWGSMDMAMYNTDIMSGLPCSSFSQMPVTGGSSSGSSGSSNWSPYPTDVHTDTNLGFYDDKIDQARKDYLDYTEKFTEASKNNDLDKMDYYQSKAREAQSSDSYWSGCRAMEEYDQKVANIRQDALTNGMNKAMNDLHNAIYK